MAEKATDILSSIRGSIRKAEIEAVRKEIKPLVEEVVKAKKLITQNEQKIAIILDQAGIEINAANMHEIMNG
jgi:hypothetical protein